MAADHVLPLTRGQLDIWLAQQTGRFDTEWQLGVLVRIEGTVEPGLLEQAIRHVMREAEPVRAAFFEVASTALAGLINANQLLGGAA